VSELGMPDGLDLARAALERFADSRTAALAASARPSRSEQAAKDFESVLLHRLLGEMKRTIPDSGLLSSATTRQMQDLFWMYLAQHLADNGGLGLWKQLHRQLGEAAGQQGLQPPPAVDEKR
jgi:Rod binding domain-containing protein